MVALMLSGEENAFRTIRGTIPSLCHLRILELSTMGLLPHCLGHPSCSQPHAQSHTPDNHCPHCGPSQTHTEGTCFSTGICTWAAGALRLVARPSDSPNAQECLWHQTYRPLRFPCLQSGSLLPCHLVALRLFIHTLAAGVVGKCVLCNTADSSNQHFPWDSRPAGVSSFSKHLPDGWGEASPATCCAGATGCGDQGSPP